VLSEEDKNKNRKIKKIKKIKNVKSKIDSQGTQTQLQFGIF
jgi:hypothetical protein